MISLDPNKTESLNKKVKILKIIWIANFVYCAAIYFIMQLIEFPGVEKNEYVLYAFVLVGIADLAIALTMRYTRFKPNVIAKIIDRGFDAVLDNFFKTEIIVMALMDSIILYGAILYVLTVELLYFQIFLVTGVLFLLYYFPKASSWIDSYNKAENYLNQR